MTRHPPTKEDIRRMLRGIRFEPGTERIITIQTVLDLAQCQIPFDPAQVLQDLVEEEALRPTGNVGEYFVVKPIVVRPLPRRKDKEEKVVLIQCPHCEGKAHQRPCPKCGKPRCEVCKDFGWCYSNLTPFIDFGKFESVTT